MRKNSSEPSINELTLLDFFAAMALISLSGSKTPLSKRAAVAYGIGAEMIKIRQEENEKRETVT